MTERLPEGDWQIDVEPAGLDVDLCVRLTLDGRPLAIRLRLDRGSTRSLIGGLEGASGAGIARTFEPALLAARCAS